MPNWRAQLKNPDIAEALAAINKEIERIGLEARIEGAKQSIMHYDEATARAVQGLCQLRLDNLTQALKGREGES